MNETQELAQRERETAASRAAVEALVASGALDLLPDRHVDAALYWIADMGAAAGERVAAEITLASPEQLATAVAYPPHWPAAGLLGGGYAALGRIYGAGGPSYRTLNLAAQPATGMRTTHAEMAGTTHAEMAGSTHAEMAGSPQAGATVRAEVGA